MRRYLKINNKNYITDIFHEHQIEKFDGTEIFYDDVINQSVWINNKVIFNEMGNPIFKLISGTPVEQPENILYTQFKQKKLDDARLKEAKDYLLETDHKIIKQIEIGEQCAQNVLTHREQCRDTIVELEGKDKKNAK